MINQRCLLIIWMIPAFVNVFGITSSLAILKLNLKIYMPQLKLTFFPFLKNNVVKVTKTLNYIPKEYIVEYHHADISLEIPKYEHFKFLHNGNDFYYSENYSLELENSINAKAYQVQANYVHLRGMFVGYQCSYLTREYEFIDLENRTELKYIHTPKNGTVKHIYENVIAVGHIYLSIFGHWFCDVLAPILLFPKSVRESSVVVFTCRVRESIYIPTLEALGFGYEQMRPLQKKEWIFANNLYTTVDPLTHIHHFGKCFRILSEKLRKYYEVDNIIPTQYSFSNRKKSKIRCIPNFDEFIEELIKSKLNVKVTVVNDSYLLKESAVIWAKSKFMFMPTGSNIYKDIFMGKNSVLVIAIGDWMDSSTAYTAAPNSLFILYFPILGMHHYYYSPFTMNTTIAIRACKIGIYCAQNGVWPQNETFSM